MNTNLIEIFQNISTLICYSYSRLATDKEFADWRNQNILEWKTITRRANELTISLNSTIDYPSIIENDSFPILIVNQIELLKTLTDELISTDESNILENVKNNSLEVIENLINFTTSKNPDKNKKQKIFSFLQYLIKEQCLNPIQTYSIFINITNEYLKKSNIKLKNKYKTIDNNEIYREIRFSPEDQQACISILSYFSVILRNKLPNIDASVSITQKGDLVILSIHHPDGTKEQITETLKSYSMVVSGEIQPEQLLPEANQALALRQKLEIAHLELKQTKEILLLTKSNYEERIKNLEEDIKFLRKNLSTQIDGNIELGQELSKSLGDLINQESLIKNPDFLPRILELIIKKDKENFIKYTSEIKKTDPNSFNEITKFLLTSSFSGVIGSSTFEWLKLIITNLPK